MSMYARYTPVLGILLLVATSSRADTTFTATLSGAQVVPPSGSSAMGSATVTLSSAGGQINAQVTFNNLSGGVSSAQLHGPAAPGATAPSLYAMNYMSSGGGGCYYGYCPPPMPGPKTGSLSGSFQISTAQTADLMAGKWYVDVESANFPNGEIRGQLVAPASQTGFGIVPGITGNWYNASQSGHGFAIEVLPGATAGSLQLLASWFVFGPTGNQAWIGGLGPVSGNSATLQAFQAGGPGAFFPPNFNASQVQTTPWGTLTFTFTDCNTGHVHWTSTATGYPPSGDIDLVRLTMPAGFTCP